MFIGRTQEEIWITLGAKIWSPRNQVGDLDEDIGALMGEISVETLPLDLHLDLETVRPHGPLPLPAMKCIRHFGKCRIE